MWTNYTQHMKNDNFQDTDKENLLTAKNFQKIFI